MVFTRTTCGYCGQSFRYPVDFGEVLFCSARCRVLVRPPENPWEYKGCTRGYYYTSRRRRKMRRGDKIDPLVVYLAFDWTCALCGGRIDPTLTMPDSMCASIEHRIPLSMGGTHTWDNTVPAHKSCNEDKDK